MNADGPFTIYFNHHQAAPLVWCIAKGNWEIAVKEVHINAYCETKYNPNKAEKDDEDGKPSAVIFVPSGKLSVSDNGLAYVNY